MYKYDWPSKHAGGCCKSISAIWTITQFVTSISLDRRVVPFLWNYWRNGSNNKRISSRYRDQVCVLVTFFPIDFYARHFVLECFWQNTYRLLLYHFFNFGASWRMFSHHSKTSYHFTKNKVFYHGCFPIHYCSHSCRSHFLYILSRLYSWPSPSLRDLWVIVCCLLIYFNINTGIPCSNWNLISSSDTNEPDIDSSDLPYLVEIQNIIISISFYLCVANGFFCIMILFARPIFLFGTYEFAFVVVTAFFFDALCPLLMSGFMLILPNFTIFRKTPQDFSCSPWYFLFILA